MKVWSKKVTRRAAALAAAALAGTVTATVSAPAAQAATATAAAWVGSPVNGSWGVGNGLPQYHHIVWNSDWSVDLRNVGEGQPVNVYVAPQDGRSSITTRVERVAPACKSGRIADGGYEVRVGIWNGGTKIGAVEYVHIQPSVSVNQELNRYGGQVGTVGRYTSSSANGCWDGVHLHLEMYSEANYSCYNRGYAPDQRLSKTNFVGFVGGSYASTQRQACP